MCCLATINLLLKHSASDRVMLILEYVITHWMSDTCSGDNCSCDKCSGDNCSPMDSYFSDSCSGDNYSADNCSSYNFSSDNLSDWLKINQLSTWLMIDMHSDLRNSLTLWRCLPKLYHIQKWKRLMNCYNIVTYLGPPAHLSIFLPPPGTLVRMHRAYLVRLAEVYGHLFGILHSFRARSRFTTLDAQTSFLQFKLQSREVTLKSFNCTASPLLS